MASKKEKEKRQEEKKGNWITMNIRDNGNFDIQSSFNENGPVVYELQRAVVWLSNRANGEDNESIWPSVQEGPGVLRARCTTALR